MPRASENKHLWAHARGAHLVAVGPAHKAKQGQDRLIHRAAICYLSRPGLPALHKRVEPRNQPPWHLAANRQLPPAG